MRARRVSTNSCAAVSSERSGSERRPREPYTRGHVGCQGPWRNPATPHTRAMQSAGDREAGACNPAAHIGGNDGGESRTPRRYPTRVARESGILSSMAPPSKVTPQIVADLERVIASGGFDEDACLVAGIHRCTLTEWRRKAARGVEPFAGIVTKLDAARAVATAAALEKMRQHEDWRATATWLEKTQPHRYAATLRVAVETAKQEYGVELGERVLERLPSAMARLGLSADKAPDLLAALLGEDASAPLELEGEIVRDNAPMSVDATTEED